MKNKRIASFSCFFMVLILTFGLTMETKAEIVYEAKWNGFTYSSFYEEEFGIYSHSRIRIDNYEGNARELTIPRKIMGRAVMEVNSLYGAKNLRTLHIPNGIEVRYALSSAPKLKKITVSKKNRKYKVRNNALLNKKGTKLLGYPGGYKTVKVPDSVVVIDDMSCWYSDFTKIKWGKNTKRIGRGAFESNHGLRTLVVNKNVEIIEAFAFNGCRNLKKVVLGPKVKEVQYSAFEDCSKLKSVYIYNKDCELDISDMDRTFPKGVTIYGKEGSTAEKYARKFRLKFITVR